MWSDIETSKDLLGYSVHASLLKDVITNEANLPITVGLYGEWGCGKTSVLKILEEILKEEEDCVVVYFDGWSFESFDDAKMALIQGIVDALEADERFFAKAGDKVSDTYKGLKKAFSELRKSISWMRVLKFSAKTVIPIATAAATGGASIIPLLLDAFNKHKGKLDDLLTGEGAESFLKNALSYEDDKKYEVVREFRNHFEELIQKSKQGKVVVLIDDLDRCLPRHIIENLEAIKLFLNVPKTAFVIAADRFIVSNAIRSEYKAIIDEAKDNRPNLGDSYMEKFIQLPYTIPALSSKEVETYVTLLFCQSILEKKEFDKVQVDFSQFRQENKFDCYGWENIEKALTIDPKEREDLFSTIAFFAHFSNIIGRSLRWNPRLIKRFLNAYEIRASLLNRSDISDQKTKFALLKLMLIEQQYTEQFKQLNNWVVRNIGTPEELNKIEQYAQGERKSDFEFKDWNNKELLQIIASQPLFSTVNLRDLFWVSRDNMIVDMSGISLIPSRIRAIFKEALDGTNKMRETTINEKVALMSQEEQTDFFDLLDAQITTYPDNNSSYIIYCMCDSTNIPGSFNRLKTILQRIDVIKIPMSVGNCFSDLLKRHESDTDLKNLLSKNKKLTRAIETAE